MQTHLPKRPARAWLVAALAAASLAALPARAADVSAPQLTHTPVTRSAPGPLKITARITDESKIFPQIFLRTGSASSFEPPIDLKKVKGSKDAYEVTITAKAGLEYYLEVYDEYGNGPARSGSPDQPFKVELVEEAAAAPAPAVAHPAPWLKGSAAETPAPKPAPAAPAPAPAAEKPATSAASDMVAAVEAASSHSARPAPVEKAAEPVHVAEKPRATPESLRERPLSTTLDNPGAINAEGALVRSLLLPGYGQFKTGREIRGAVFTGAAVAGVATSVILAVRANQANNVLDTAPPSVRGEASDQAWRYTRARNIAICVTALVWLGQAAEAYFGFGTHD